MTYSPRYYQPSVLELARQGNFQAIAYWINSIFAPQGIHIQANSKRAGCLTIMVNFPRTRHPQACISARQQLVRHLCYRLWTLNSGAIREVRIMARVAGQRDILWRQSVRLGRRSTPKKSLHRPHAASVKRRSVQQERFQLLRSFLLNRIAIAGFIFCYWVMYLEATGHQAAEQRAATTPTQEQVQLTQAITSQPESEKTAIAHSRRPQDLVFTVPPQFQGQVIHEATPPAGAEKVVALTFDDGPWENTTEQILDILKQNNIKSTFYFVGQAIQANPHLAKKVVEEGHAVGNHTWQHLMENMDAATAAQELGNNARLIYEATGGVRTYLMRPPGGNLEGDLAAYAKQQGYLVTMWSADSHDYYVSAPLIVDNVLSHVKPGGIVLMHDGGGDRSATVEALPQIISTLQRQGYKFVTVPELMEKQAKWATMQPPIVPPGTEAAPSPEADPLTPNQPTIDQPTIDPLTPDPAITAPVETPIPAPAPFEGNSTESSPPSPSLMPNGAVPSNPSPVMQDAGAI